MTAIFTHSNTLFTIAPDDGPRKPIVFCMRPCSERKRLKPIVEHGGGQVRVDTKTSLYKLAEKGSTVTTDDFLSTDFVYDSAKKNKLQKTKDYRLKPGQVPTSPSTSEYDSDMSPAATITNLARSCKGRSKYTLDEDKAMLSYIVEEKKHHLTSGMNLWKEMEELKVTNHTAASMSTRFRKIIIPNIKNYKNKVPAHWLSLLTGHSVKEKDDDNFSFESLYRRSVKGFGKIRTPSESRSTKEEPVTKVITETYQNILDGRTAPNLVQKNRSRSPSSVSDERTAVSPTSFSDHEYLSCADDSLEDSGMKRKEKKIKVKLDFVNTKQHKTGKSSGKNGHDSQGQNGKESSERHPSEKKSNKPKNRFLQTLDVLPVKPSTSASDLEQNSFDACDDDVDEFDKMLLKHATSTPTNDKSQASQQDTDSVELDNLMEERNACSRGNQNVEGGKLLKEGDEFDKMILKHATSTPINDKYQASQPDTDLVKSDTPRKEKNHRFRSKKKTVKLAFEDNSKSPTKRSKRRSDQNDRTSSLCHDEEKTASSVKGDNPVKAKRTHSPHGAGTSISVSPITKRAKTAWKGNQYVDMTLSDASDTQESEDTSQGMEVAGETTNEEPAVEREEVRKYVQTVKALSQQLKISPKDFHSMVIANNGDLARAFNWARLAIYSPDPPAWTSSDDEVITDCTEFERLVNKYGRKDVERRAVWLED